MPDSHRAYVGPAEKYDIIGASQFCLLISYGLREHHKLLDIGCGSLRAGRFFLPYLLPGNYYGIEPNRWLIDAAFQQELGWELHHLRRPTFHASDKFDLQFFDTHFDYVLAQSIFTHTTLLQLRTCIQNAAAVTRPGGIFLATFLAGATDYAGNEWNYNEGVTFMESTVRAIAEEYFVCMLIDWPHPNGQTWIQMVRNNYPRI